MNRFVTKGSPNAPSDPKKQSKKAQDHPQHLKLKLDCHTVSHVELVVFAERVDKSEMCGRVGEPVGVLLVDPRRFGGLLALFLGGELVVE